MTVGGWAEFEMGKVYGRLGCAGGLSPSALHLIVDREFLLKTLGVHEKPVKHECEVYDVWTYYE